MKKLILIFGLVMVCGINWACSECQGAVDKGETPPKYWKVSWQERIAQTEEKFNKMHKEHTLMYRMLSELYIKEMGYEAYEKIVYASEKRDDKKEKKND